MVFPVCLFVRVLVEPFSVFFQFFPVEQISFCCLPPFFLVFFAGPFSKVFSVS